MNKAFIKEPEPSDTAHCPRCGSLGVLVHEPTLAAHVRREVLEVLANVAWFCPFPTCDVAYFDSFGRLATTGQLVQPVYPKDPDAPICACFGLSTSDIDQDLAEGGVRRTRALLEQAKSPAAQCLWKAASGQSCVGDVQRYYMQRRAKH